MRKFMLGVVSLAAAFALFSVPGTAFGATYGTCASGMPETKPPCKASEHFTEFSEAGESVAGKKVSTTFVLEATASKETITCTGVAAGGTMWNESSVGRSHVALRFLDCTVKGTELEAVCPSTVKINGNGVIEGLVTDKVKSETEVEVTVESGFGVKCGETNLGGVTGTVVGKQTASTAVLKLEKATGLTFAGKAASIAGEVEFLTGAAQKVFIGPPAPRPAWYINGAELASGNTETFSASAAKEFVLEAEPVALEVLVIKCPTLAATEAQIEGGMPAEDEAHLQFTACKATGNGKECVVSTPTLADGEIVTGKVNSELEYLKGGVVGDKFKPATKEKGIIAEINIYQGPKSECPGGLAGKIFKLEGVVVASINEPNVQKKEKLFEFTKPVVEGSALTLNGRPAILTGVAELELTSSLKWTGM